MNVIQMAMAQASYEHASTRRGPQPYAPSKKRGPPLHDGTLQWLGEYNGDSGDTRSHALQFGDKVSLTAQQQRALMRSPFEQGYAEYLYEGQLRLLRAVADGAPADLGASASSAAVVAAVRGADRDPRGAIREGHGTLKYPGGELFDGPWKNGRRHGDDGSLSLPCGYRYQGQWDDDVPHGRGFESFPDRTGLDAQFADGKPHGPGVMLFAEGAGYRYEGEFAAGVREGRGTVFYENGDVFVGHWRGGKRHGRGVTTVTRPSGAGDVQYGTEWCDGALVRRPLTIERGKRTHKPRGAALVRTHGFVPADLAAWRVRPGTAELPWGDFMRLKLGFERLDLDADGRLTGAELAAAWGDEGCPETLLLLDADGAGSVELADILAAWYPAVPPHDVARFMQPDLNPRRLLALRGFLGGVASAAGDGYLHVVGQRSLEALGEERQRPLSVKALQAAAFRIGGERFNVADFEGARSLSDPPLFAEVLESWFPLLSRAAVRRYEAEHVPAADLEAAAAAFVALADGRDELPVAALEAAQQRWRNRIIRRQPDATAGVTVTDGSATPPAQPVAPLAAAPAAAPSAAPVPVDSPVVSPPSTAASGSAEVPADTALIAAGAPIDSDTQAAAEAAEAMDDADAAAAAAPPAEPAAAAPLTPSLPADVPPPAAAPAAPVPALPPLERTPIPGFFRGEPVWPVGPLRLSVRLAQAVESYEGRGTGTVTLSQLLRYCYPNVRCARSQELLLAKARWETAGPCGCQICAIAAPL